MAHWSDGLERVQHPDGRILIGGSFRGVVFFVESSDRSGGRRIVTHEFAQSDLPAHDDLGRKARTFRVIAYVLGVDYIAKRDALLSALEDREGAGELIHPYFGPRRVRCGGVDLRESIANGGVATFSIEFLDAPLTVAPTITADLASQVVESSAVAFTRSQDQFDEEYSVEGQPSFATTSLSGELSALTLSLESALRPVVSDTQELALMNQSVDAIIADAASLVRRPLEVINAFLDVVLQLTESILDAPGEMLTALMDAYDTTPTADVLGDTSTRDQERTNQLALSDALRRALVIQAAVMAPDATFATVGEATDLRDRISGALDVLASTAGDSAYPSIVDLRSAVVRAIPGDKVLASEQTVRLKIDTPSIVIAYRLYGSVAKAVDIAERNNAQNPAFMSGDVEVLSFE